MIPHVAEAGEVKGRVVLRLGAAPVHPLALTAAVRVAHAFQAEIEGLFVEDAELFDVATHRFAREIGHGGRVRRMLSAAQLGADLAATARAVRRHVDRIAAASEVPVVHRTVRADPIAALQAACAEVGPWNVIALAEPLGPRDEQPLRVLMQAVTEAQGVLAVSANVQRTRGPVLVALEAIDHLANMMHAADRLGRSTGEAIVVLLIGRTAEETAEFEAHARLMLCHRDDVRLVASPGRFGDPASVIDVIHRQAGGILLAELGGLAMPADERFALAVAALECPVFLVR